MNKLVYILREANDEGKNEYGIFCLDRAPGSFSDRPVIRRHFSREQSLEMLAEEVGKKFHNVGLSAFTFEKRENFPDFCINDGKNVSSYHELSAEEREKFLTYLRRTLKGEPAKKRHNPEITSEDRANAEVKE